MYANWEAKARDVAAYLRFDAARSPGDPDIAALSAVIPGFREVWAAHDVKEKTHGRCVYPHPVVGTLDLRFETLTDFRAAASECS